MVTDLYLAIIDYIDYDWRQQVILGIFTTPELAKKRCVDHHKKEYPQSKLVLTWTQPKKMEIYDEEYQAQGFRGIYLIYKLQADRPINWLTTI